MIWAITKLKVYLGEKHYGVGSYPELYRKTIGLYPYLEDAIYECRERESHAVLTAVDESEHIIK